MQRFLLSKRKEVLCLQQKTDYRYFPSTLLKKNLKSRQSKTAETPVYIFMVRFWRGLIPPKIHRWLMWRYFSAGVGIISNLQTMPTLCGGVLIFHKQRESLSIFFILVYKCACSSKIDVHFLVKTIKTKFSSIQILIFKDVRSLWDHFFMVHFSCSSWREESSFM